MLHARYLLSLGLLFTFVLSLNTQFTTELYQDESTNAYIERQISELGLNLSKRTVTAPNGDHYQRRNAAADSVIVNSTNLIKLQSELKCDNVENGLVAQFRDTLYLLSANQLFLVSVRESKKSLVPVATFEPWLGPAFKFSVHPETDTKDDRLIVIIALNTHYNVYAVTVNQLDHTFIPIQKISIDGESAKVMIFTKNDELQCILVDKIDQQHGSITLLEWRSMYFKQLGSVSTDFSIDSIDIEFYDHGELILIVAVHYSDAKSHIKTTIQVYDGDLNTLQALYTNSTFVKLARYKGKPKLLTCLPEECLALRWENKHFINPMLTNLNYKIVELQSKRPYILIRNPDNVLYLYNRKDFKYSAGIQLHPPSQESQLEMFAITTVENVTMVVMTYKDPSRFRFEFYEIKNVTDSVLTAQGDGDGDLRAASDPLAHIDKFATELKALFDKTFALISKINTIIPIIIRNDGVVRLEEITVAGSVEIAKASTVSHVAWANQNNTRIKSDQLEQLIDELATKTATLKLQSENLIYHNANNVIKDMTINGDLRTKGATIPVMETHMLRAQSHDAANEDEERILVAKRVRVTDLITNSPAFTNLLSKTKRNSLSGDLNVQHLVANEILSTSGIVNQIPLSQLFLAGTNVSILGEKRMVNLTTRALTIKDTFNGYSITKVSKLQSNHDQLSVQTINAREIVVANVNNVNVEGFLKEAFLKDTPQRAIIAGNLIFARSTNVDLLDTVLLNGIPATDLFTLTTDQIISRPVNMDQFFATDLHTGLINGIHFNEDVALLGQHNVIETPVKIGVLSVVHKLTLSEREDREMTQHIVGTRVEDLSQTYRGVVTINGNLIVNNVTLEDPATDQLFLGGDPFTLPSLDHYWTIDTHQKFNTVMSFDGWVTTPQVHVHEINKYLATDYLMVDQRDIRGEVHLHFAKTIIRGNIQTIGHSQVAHISQNAVWRGQQITLNNFKRFQHLYTDHLITNYVNDHPITDIYKTTDKILSFNQPITFDSLYLNDGLDYHMNNLYVGVINNAVNIENLFSETVYTNHPIDLVSIYIDEVVAEDMTVETLSNLIHANVALEQLKAMKFVVNVTSGNPTHIDRLYVRQRVNGIDIKEYLSLVVHKPGPTVGQEPIELGGVKKFLKGLTVRGDFQVHDLSGIDMIDWMQHVLRQNIHQVITANWYFANLTVPHLYANHINNAPCDQFIDGSRGAIFSHELHINQLVLNNCQMLVNTPYPWPEIIYRLHHPVTRHWMNMNITGDMLMPESNSELWELISHGVHTTKPQNISGSVQFQGMVHIDELLTNGRKINNIDMVAMIKDTLMANLTEPQIVSGATEFADNVEVEHLRVTNIDVVHINRVNMLELRQQMWSPINNYSKDLNSCPILNFLGQVKVNKLTVQSINASDLALNENDGILGLATDRVLQVNDLYVQYINQMPLAVLLDQRAKLIVGHGHGQHFSGELHFDELIIQGPTSTIDSINGIYIDDILLSTTEELQEITGHVSVANLHLFGPANIQYLNGNDLTDLYKSTVDTAKDQQLDQLSVDHLTVADGLRVNNFINGIPISYFFSTNVSLNDLELKRNELMDILGKSQAWDDPRQRMKRFTYLDYSEDFEMVAKEDRMRSEKALIIDPNHNNIVCNRCPCKRESPIKLTVSKKIIRIPQLNVTLPIAMDGNEIAIQDSSNCSLSTTENSLLITTSAGVEHVVPIKGVITFVQLFREADLVYAIIGVQMRDTVNVTVIKMQDIWQPNTILFANSTNAYFHLMECREMNYLLVSIRAPTAKGSLTYLYKFIATTGKFERQQGVPTNYNLIRHLLAPNKCFLFMAKHNRPALDIYQLEARVNARSRLETVQKLTFSAALIDAATFSVATDHFVAVGLRNGFIYIYMYNYLQGWRKQSYGDLKQIGTIERLLRFELEDAQYLLVTGSKAATVISIYTHYD